MMDSEDEGNEDEDGVKITAEKASTSTSRSSESK